MISTFSIAWAVVDIETKHRVFPQQTDTRFNLGGMD